MEAVCSSELSRSVIEKRDLASGVAAQAAAAAGSLVWFVSAMMYLSSEIGLWGVGSEAFIGYDSFHPNIQLLVSKWTLERASGVFKFTFDEDSMVCSRLSGKNKAKAVPAFENKDDDDSEEDEEDEEEGDDEDDDGGEEDASGDEGDNKKEVEDEGDGEDAPVNGEGGSEDEDDDEGGDDDEDDDGEDDEDEEEEDEDDDDDEDPEPPAKKRK